VLYQTTRGGSVISPHRTRAGAHDPVVTTSA
jgi:hypothetical protein